MSSEEIIKIEALPHHIRQKVCQTRSPYRRGRRETAVKVLTISEESKYLLIQRVPDIKSDVKQELRKLCQKLGSIERLVLTEYPNNEEFTKTYLIKYKNFLNAIKAKKCLDDFNFMGSVLHVCYAPELESIDETKEKLNLRLKYVPSVLIKKQSSSERPEQTVVEEFPNIEDKSYPQISPQMTDKSETNLKRKFDEMNEQLSKTLNKSHLKSDAPKERPKIRWKTKVK